MIVGAAAGGLRPGGAGGIVGAFWVGRVVVEGSVGRFPEPGEVRGRVSAPRAWFQVAICHPPAVRVRPVAHSCRRLIPLTRSLSQASFLATPR